MVTVHLDLHFNIRVFRSFQADLTLWTDAWILSYVKMLSCTKDLVLDICGQNFNISELHKY